MALAPPKMRRERNMFTSSDDTAMMKQIQATHASDGREFSVKPLLHIVEDIFLRATTVPGITDIVQHQVYTQPVVVLLACCIFICLLYIYIGIVIYSALLYMFMKITGDFYILGSSSSTT